MDVPNLLTVLPAPWVLVSAALLALAAAAAAVRLANPLRERLRRWRAAQLERALQRAFAGSRLEVVPGGDGPARTAALHGLLGRVGGGLAPPHVQPPDSSLSPQAWLDTQPAARPGLPPDDGDPGARPPAARRRGFADTGSPAPY